MPLPRCSLIVHGTLPAMQTVNDHGDWMSTTYVGVGLAASEAARLEPSVWARAVHAAVDAVRALCRDTIIDALSPLGALGSGIAGGEGAIYLWAKLPEGDDFSFGLRPQCRTRDIARAP